MSVKGILSVNFDPPQLEFLPEQASILAGTRIFGQEPEMIRGMLVDLGLFGANQTWPGHDCCFRVSIALSRQQLDRLKAAARGATH